MRNKLITLLALAAVVVSSCTYYPDDASIVEEQLVAVTQYDTKVDFTHYTTFSVPDNVYYITGFNSVTGKTSGTYVPSPTITQAVTDNMVARGYTKVTVSPDLDIQLTAVVITNVSVYYPGWWWDYYPYYPYYPYPYAPVVSSYSTGTLIMDIIDMDPVYTKSKPIIWTGLVRGLLDNSHTTGQLTTSINECFDQTPGFKK